MAFNEIPQNTLQVVTADGAVVSVPAHSQRPTLDGICRELQFQIFSHLLS